MKVSVAMITYNQEAFVAEAIEGVLKQQCAFDFELVVGEDCSTDGTRRIVDSYARRHPQRLRLCTSTANVGAQRNLERVLAACTGEYMALLDGDDFWTTSHKLQRQVDYLEEHPRCALCFHNVQLADHGGTVHPPVFTNPPDQPPRSDLQDLLRDGNFITTCSVMYRRGLVTSLPAWWGDIWIGDWALHALHARHGWIGYIDEVMAAYRVHPGGLWSGASLVDRVDGHAQTAMLLGDSLGPPYQRLVRQHVFAVKESAAEELLQAGQQDLAGAYVLWLVSHLRWRGRVPVSRVARLAGQQYFPRVAARGGRAYRALHARHGRSR